MMKKQSYLLLLLFATPVWAFSELKCVSNSNVTYSNRSLVGGARPFPGMVVNVEEIEVSHALTYRLVSRESCGGWPACVMQQPELFDVVPAGFGFSFFPATKQILAQDGSTSGATFHEVYTIQFRINQAANIWMLCDYSSLMAP